MILLLMELISKSLKIKEKLASMDLLSRRLGPEEMKSHDII
jgi:hypothetical protein